MIGASDGVLVMLHDDHGVAQVAQPAERAEQSLVVPLMQADAGLVEDVEHADQPGADLGGEADPLHLAAAQRGSPTAEREVAQPDVAEKAQPIGRFLEDRPGDLGIEPRAAGGAQRNRLEEVHRAVHGEVHDVADAPAFDQHRQALGLEPLAVTGGAGLLDQKFLERHAHGIAGGLAVAALDVPEHAFPFALVVALAPATVGREAEAPGRAVHEGLPRRLRVLAPGGVELEPERLREGGQHHLPEIARRLAPGEDHALEDGDTGIAQDQVDVHFLPRAQAVAVGAHAEGRIEGELPGLELRHREPADRAGKAFGEHHRRGGLAVMTHYFGDAVGLAECRLD